VVPYVILTAQVTGPSFLFIFKHLWGTFGPAVGNRIIEEEEGINRKGLPLVKTSSYLPPHCVEANPFLMTFMDERSSKLKARIAKLAKIGTGLPEIQQGGV